MAWYRCGGESPTGNAIEAEVLAGKTFSNDDGTDKVGTMVNNGAVTQSLNTGRTSYTIPQGYHSGSGSVSITTQEKTATPTTSAQAITPDSGKVLSKVTVNAIQTQEKTVTAGTAAASVTPDSGKYLSKVTYNPTPTQEKTITSSRTAQTVTPDGGKHLSKVTVNKYPDANGTYTYPANSTGGTYDMGTTNNLRYVNATNVYNKGKADGKTEGNGNFNGISSVTAYADGDLYIKGLTSATKVTFICSAGSNIMMQNAKNISCPGASVRQASSATAVAYIDNITKGSTYTATFSLFSTSSPPILRVNGSEQTFTKVIFS